MKSFVEYLIESKWKLSDKTHRLLHHWLEGGAFGAAGVHPLVKEKFSKKVKTSGFHYKAIQLPKHQVKKLEAGEPVELKHKHTSWSKNYHGAAGFAYDENLDGVIVKKKLREKDVVVHIPKLVKHQTPEHKRHERRNQFSTLSFWAKKQSETIVKPGVYTTIRPKDIVKFISSGRVRKK